MRSIWYHGNDTETDGISWSCWGLVTSKYKPFHCLLKELWNLVCKMDAIFAEYTNLTNPSIQLSHISQDRHHSGTEMYTFLFQCSMGQKYIGIISYDRNWLCCLCIYASTASVFFAESGTDLTWLSITLAMLGKFAINSSFTIIYVYGPEIYPTVLR